MIVTEAEGEKGEKKKLVPQTKHTKINNRMRTFKTPCSILALVLVFK